MGHASTAISAALGIAVARDLKGEHYKVVAVIGDGALTGGMAFEALNNAGVLKNDLIVVLNDNEMCISPNVGAMPPYLTKITSGKLYNRFESDVWELLGHLPHGGGRRRRAAPDQGGPQEARRAERPLRGDWVSATSARSTATTCRCSSRRFEQSGDLNGPVLVHTVTQKGKGYPVRRERPHPLHGVARFDKAAGVTPSEAGRADVHRRLRQTRCSSSRGADPRVVAITAAMPDSTGLTEFGEQFPDRCSTWASPSSMR